MKRRVVVTGLGAVTPVGNTVEEFWSSVREGKVGIGPITKFDTSEYKVKLAAEVKGFSAKERMDFKAAKRMEPFAQYAVAAAKEAFEDAKIDMSQENPYRAGVIVGSGIGSLQAVETNYEKILQKGPSRVNPLMVPLMISNMAAGNVSIQLGFKGKCTSVVTACASGTAILMSHLAHQGPTVSETDFVRLHMEIWISAWQEVQKAVSAQAAWQDLRR